MWAYNLTSHFSSLHYFRKIHFAIQPAAHPLGTFVISEQANYQNGSSLSWGMNWNNEIWP